MRSMARGKAASELVVAKAMETGSAIAPMNFRMGTLASSATGRRTKRRNATSARYKVPRSFARFTRMPRPMWPTV